MELLAKLNNCSDHLHCEVSDIPSFEVSMCSVSLTVYDNGIEIKINGNPKNNSKEKLLELFNVAYSLVFIAAGSFPPLKSISIDGCSLDPSSLLVKYSTSKAYDRSYFCFFAIDSSLINPTTINAMMGLAKKPLSSFEYIVSESYENVVADHKIALLLQSLEGLSNSIEKKGHKKFSVHLENVFQKFFEVQKVMEDSEKILGMLNITEADFYKTLYDTRHDVTHYLEEIDKGRLEKDRKEGSITRQDDGGTLAFEYIYCLYISIRLYLIKKIVNIEPNMKNVRESILVARDWIYEHKCKREGCAIDKEQYKSLSYRNKPISEVMHQAEKKRGG